MGANVSIAQKNISDISNSICQSISQTVTTKNASSCISNQNATIINEATGKIECGVEIAQVTETTCNMDSKTNVNLKSDITSTLNNKFEDLMKADNDVIQGFMATASANMKIDQFKDEVVKNVSQSFSNSDVFTSCVNTLVVNQDGTISNKGTIGCSQDANGRYSIRINQKSIENAITSCMADTLTDIIMKNTLVSDVISKMEAENKLKQEGLSLTFLIAILLIFLAPLGVALITSGRLLAPVRNPKTGRVDIIPWMVNLTVLIVMWFLIATFIIMLWDKIKEFFRKVFEKLDPRNWGK
jgi:hypothetical protein